jgi:hypothetical protein
MPQPPTPPDLKHCDDCGKVIGSHKGWFGGECHCGQPKGDALRGAHGAGTGRGQRLEVVCRALDGRLPIRSVVSVETSFERFDQEQQPDNSGRREPDR